MISVRRAEQRGRFDFGWLETSHTFSFGDYHDPRHMGFRSLRVINEDRLKPGAGFPSHPHREMEILSYVLEGALAHRDSTGSGSVLRRGEIQRMSAGSGIMHSEFNASSSEPLHFYQIWVLPARQGLRPSYEQRFVLPPRPSSRELYLVASPDGEGLSVTVNQDLRLYVIFLEPDQRLSYTIHPGRSLWVQMARGTAALGDLRLRAGDGASLSAETSATLEAEASCEILLFDLA